MALNKRKVLETARKFAQKGAKAKALKEYNKLLQADPRDAKLLLEVGDAYRRWGQNEEAIAQYGKVAQQYRQDGFDARAVAVFKQILNLDPKNYGAYVSLSELYQRMGLDAEAVGALQTAADGYHKEGRKAEALELLRQMAALDPTNTTSRLKVAELLRQEGMEAEAIAEYEAVIAELDNQDDRDQLVTVYERILEVKPDQLTALMGVARQLIVVGELERAEPMAVRALDVSADPPQYELLMDLYAQMGNEPKLAEVTRGLAKLYRDRGDDEKARDLMQRLPVSDSVSSSRLAVDVSEVAEPDLDDEELLDDEDSFLALDQQEDLAAAESPGLDIELEGASDEFVLDLGMDEAARAAEAASSAPQPLPEGDPDQLLAEASVYLRYGKRDQAIASLRGVLAQDPNHRAALEKLGEAYADDGQASEAVHFWLQAAEQVRLSGDAEALGVLRDRIATLDPDVAEQVGTIEPAARPAKSGAGASASKPAAPVLELDLDLEVDLDLDHAIDEVSSSVTHAGLDFDSDPGGLVIDLDENSVTFDSPPVSESTARSDAPVVEMTAPEFEATDGAATDDDSEFEFEIDGDDLSFVEDDTPDANASAEEVSVDVEVEVDARTSSGSHAEQSTTTAARIAEELEEAEFYIAQEMYDEASQILERILEMAPNHPAALLRMGEVTSARGQMADSAGKPSGKKAGATNDFEVTAQFGDKNEETQDEVSVDVQAIGLDEDDDFEIEVDLDEDEDEAEQTADDVGVDVDADVEVESADEELAAASEEESDDARSEEVSEGATVDPGDTFDLREALADVFADDDSTDANADSGVLSTVEDGFESIFSDFKKGVTATLEQGDYETRYDLGIAYREMGLYEDAIGEFRVCLDSTDRRFDSLYLMGLCARDLGRFPDAVSHLEQALAMPNLPEERMAGVYFDLSEAQSKGGDRARACASLQRVIELEPDFPGASERLSALEAGQDPSSEGTDADQGYESFDDLFGNNEDDVDGDEEIIEAATVETFESFDDLVSEAEAVLDSAEFEEVETSANEESSGSTESDDASTSSTRKGGRKKISFV